MGRKHCKKNISLTEPEHVEPLTKEEEEEIECEVEKLKIKYKLKRKPISMSKIQKYEGYNRTERSVNYALDGDNGDLTLSAQNKHANSVGRIGTANATSKVRFKLHDSSKFTNKQ